MRIVSWNVNGIRACWGNGLRDFLDQVHPDVITFQEVKSLPETLPDEIRHPDGFRAIWHCGGRPGYSGVAAFIREDAVQPLWHLKGMGLPHIDSEGRCLTLEFDDFFLVSAYFPNSGGRARRKEYKSMFCRTMRHFCHNLSQRGKSVLLTGDYNIAPFDIDLYSPQAAQGQPGTLDSEVRWMRTMLEEGWVDLFRRDRPGEPGHYSWWSFFDQDREFNRGWRIDHALALGSDFSARLSCHLRPDVPGSDHCPVVVDLQT